MGLNNRGTVKECNQLPFLVTFLNLALIYCHIPFNHCGAPRYPVSDDKNISNFDAKRLEIFFLPDAPSPQGGKRGWTWLS